MGHAYISHFTKHQPCLSRQRVSSRGCPRPPSSWRTSTSASTSSPPLMVASSPVLCSPLKRFLSSKNLQLSTRKLHFRWIWREHTCPQIKWRGFFRRSSSAAAAFKVLCWGVRDDWKSWTSLSITCRLFHQPRWQNSSSISSRWRFLQCSFPTNI